MAQEFESRQVLDDGLTKAQLADSALYLSTTDIDHTSSPYLVLETDEVLSIDTTTSAVSVSLPLVGSVPAGRKITIKDSGGNAGTNRISVFPNAADFIEGLGTPLYLESNYVSLTLLQAGTEWVRLDSFGTITQPEDIGFILEGDIPGERLVRGEIFSNYEPDFDPNPTDTDDIPGNRSVRAKGMFPEPLPQNVSDGGTDDVPVKMTTLRPLIGGLTPQVANNGGTDDIPVNMV